jgi:hypothetical protein
MSQERLIPLGTLPIENNIAQSLEFSKLAKSFADMKAREDSFNESTISTCFSKLNIALTLLVHYFYFPRLSPARQKSIAWKHHQSEQEGWELARTLNKFFSRRRNG